MRLNYEGVRTRQPFYFGGDALTFLLRDDFRTAEAAPLTSPRVADSVGHWKVVQDADDDWKIVSGYLQREQLTFWPDAYLVLSDASETPLALSPRAGLAMFIRDISSAPNKAIVGFSGTIDDPVHIRASNGGSGLYNNGIYSGESPSVWDDGDNLVLITRSRGAYLIDADTHALRWVVDAGAGDPLYAMVSEVLAADQDVVDAIRVARLPGARGDAVSGNGFGEWDHRDLDVSASAASPVNGQVYDATSDCIVSITADSIIGTGQALYIRYRIQDGDNNWFTYVTETGSLFLYKRVDGTPELKVNTAGVTDGMRIDTVVAGDRYRVYADGMLKIDYSGDAQFIDEVGGSASFNAPIVVSDFEARTLDGFVTSPWEGPELVEDGDMEAAGTSAYTATACILSKQTDDPYEGDQVLRVAYNASSNVVARQYQGGIKSGKRYHIQARARTGGGGIQARVSFGASNNWQGTIGTTSWEEVDVELGVDSPGGYIQIWGYGGSPGEYVEFDVLSVHEVPPLYNSVNWPGYGPATYVLPGPRAVNDAFTHEADCVIEFTLGPLPTDNNYIMLRIQDSQNFIRLLWTAAGDLYIYKVVAGSPNQQGSALGALSGGERIVVVLEAGTQKVYYDTTLAFTVSISEFQNESLGKIQYVGDGGRISNLIARPRSFASAPLTPGAARANRALDLLAAGG